MTVEESKPSAAAALFSRLLLDFAQKKPDELLSILKKAEASGAVPEGGWPGREEISRSETIVKLASEQPALLQAVLKDPLFLAFVSSSLSTPSTPASRAPSGSASSPISGPSHFSSDPGRFLGQGFSSPSYSSGKKCFVATAAFGSPLAPEVGVLRAWRDESLAASGLGRALIRVYDAAGPHLAGWTEGSAIRRRASRLLLTPFIGLVRCGRRARREDRGVEARFKI